MKMIIAILAVAFALGTVTVVDAHVKKGCQKHGHKHCHKVVKK